jgi:hypothetical protein
VRKVRRADELTAAGKTGQEIAAELGVSAATLYNSRRTYGGMDTDAAKELKELREQNARLKRLLPDESTRESLLHVVISQGCNGSAKARSGWPTLRLVLQGNNGYVESFSNQLRK